MIKSENIQNFEIRKKQTDQKDGQSTKLIIPATPEMVQLTHDELIAYLLSQAVKHGLIEEEKTTSMVTSELYIWANYDDLASVLLKR